MNRNQHDWWENVQVSSVRRVDHSKKMSALRDEIIDEIYEAESPSHKITDRETGEIVWTPDEDITHIPSTLLKNLVVLFALSVGTMERQVRDILSGELLTDEFEEDKIFEEKHFGENLELARKTGAIDSGTYSKAVDVKNTRNKLVHDPTYRYTIENIPATVDRVNKAVEAPEKMHERWIEIVRN